MEILLLCVAAAWLAYVNGANDNSKGVATLIGSGILSRRSAIYWGTFTTFIGSVAAIGLSQGLIAVFSGKGLLPDATLATPAFLISVGLGAAGTIFVATRTGFPISTTHALVGGLVGVGLVAGQLNSEQLLQSFLLPLLLSPFLAALGAAALHLLFKSIGRLSGITLNTCLCIGREQTSLGVRRLRITQESTTEEQGFAFSIATPIFKVSESQQCAQRFPDGYLGLHLHRAADTAHLLSAGLVSFARGLNDTPKIAALLLTAHLFEIPTWISLLIIGGFIAAGGLISSKAVTKTMSQGITPMDRSEGLAGNIITAALVLFASKLGVPVSTTHVSCGSLFGIGAVNRSARWKTIGKILVAWVVTLPSAALLAALAFAWLR